MPNEQLPVQQTRNLSLEVLKGTYNLALTRVNMNLQAMHNKATKFLVITEDNINEAAKFIEELRAAKDIIKTEHQKIKEPVLREYQLIDSSKREMESEIDTVLTPTLKNYTKLVNEIERKRIEQEQDRLRKEKIQKGIENNMIDFARRIAACDTIKDLTNVERSINLEKSYANKYQEFFESAKEKYGTLTNNIAQQKEHIKELEKDKKKLAAAKSNADEQTINDLQQRIDDKENTISESKINVQEAAINAATAATPSFETAEEVLPDVKARRSVWKWEVQDMNLLEKRMPQLVVRSASKEGVDKMLKEFRENGTLDNKQEYVTNGIRFFQEKFY